MKKNKLSLPQMAALLAIEITDYNNYYQIGRASCRERV